jgi:hypothetical protein
MPGPNSLGDDWVRALLVCHTRSTSIFKRFRQEFENGFGKCDFIDSAEYRRFVLLIAFGRVS